MVICELFIIFLLVYLIFKKRFTLVFILFSSTAWGVSPCDTHEICHDNHCECTIFAVSAYNRFFYFTIPSIIKGNEYECRFTAVPDNVTLQFKDSIFPQGVITDYRDTENYNAGTNTGSQSLKIDTTNMIKEVDDIIFKFYIPGSDIPIDMSIRCKKI